MESAESENALKTWLISMTGKMVQVVILQKAMADRPEHVIWKGQGKVVRCVQEGVVLDLNAGGASWWRQLWEILSIKHIVPRWIQKPFSVPYCDLSIDLKFETGEKCLVIDAATWKRSPEDLMQKKKNSQGEKAGGD